MELFRRDVCGVMRRASPQRDSNAEAGEKDFWLRYPYGNGRGMWAKAHGIILLANLKHTYPALCLMVCILFIREYGCKKQTTVSDPFELLQTSSFDRSLETLSVICVLFA